MPDVIEGTQKETAAFQMLHSLEIQIITQIWRWMCLLSTRVCVFSESEDEVEEIEERVPSPDAAPEESAPFYDPVAW